MPHTPATEALIKALQRLPGIGPRSAQRMALYLLERDVASGQQLSESLQTALQTVHKCPQCRALTEHALCRICDDPSRDKSIFCVVENESDKSAIEMSRRFTGRYFVLHGVLSPIDAVGPEELGIFELIDRIGEQGVTEVLFALDEKMESEATIHYISEQIRVSQPDIKRSRVRFANLKSGSLDTADSHQIVNAMTDKKEIGFEHD